MTSTTIDNRIATGNFKKSQHSRSKRRKAGPVMKPPSFSEPAAERAASRWSHSILLAEHSTDVPHAESSAGGDPGPASGGRACRTAFLPLSRKPPGSQARTWLKMLRMLGPRRPAVRAADRAARVHGTRRRRWRRRQSRLRPDEARAVGGTPGYMAPEAARSGSVKRPDCRTRRARPDRSRGS